jgi:hypothetical protein
VLQLPKIYHIDVKVVLKPQKSLAVRRDAPTFAVYYCTITLQNSGNPKNIKGYDRD